MPASITAPTYYMASANRRLATPVLDGDVKADVCIIGAGYTGLSAALELAGAGLKVVVLEASTIGSGASGRNGGQVCTGFSSSQAKIEAQLGKADAAKAFAMAEESKALLTDRIARHRIDCDLRWGYLHTITKPSHQDELKAWKAELDGLGVAMAGSVEPLGRKMTSFVEELGGAPHATVLGSRLRTAPPNAALANATTSTESTRRYRSATRLK